MGVDNRKSERDAARDRGVRAAEATAAAAEVDVPDSGRWASASQIAICGIFLIVMIAALELARPILLPATFAFVIGLMLGPLSARAKDHGVPSLLTAIVLWLLVVGVCYGLIALLASPIMDWIGKAPEIGRIIKEKLSLFDGPLSTLQELRKSILPEDDNTRVGVDIVSFVTPALNVVTPAIGQTMIFFGTLFFVLLGRTKLRAALVSQFNDHDARLRTLRIWNDIGRQLTDYLSIVAVINVAVGVGAGIIAFAVGLPNAIAWGVLAFLLNFIPYIGAVIMQLVLLAVGLVTFPTLAQAILAPLLYLAYTTLEGHFITPGIMGRRLTLEPLVVFLALVFWTWLWGPAGAFLAVPLVIVAMVSLNHIFPKAGPVLPD